MKNLEELAERCEKENIQYAYGVFQEEISPPHLVALETDTDNFMADNRVFNRKGTIQLDLTMDYIDFDLIDKVENKILYDVCWNKIDTTYLSDEKIWQVSYFFEI